MKFFFFFERTQKIEDSGLLLLLLLRENIPYRIFFLIFFCYIRIRLDGKGSIVGCLMDVCQITDRQTEYRIISDLYNIKLYVFTLINGFYDLER